MCGEIYAQQACMQHTVAILEGDEISSNWETEGNSSVMFKDEQDLDVWERGGRHSKGELLPLLKLQNPEIMRQIPLCIPR